MTSLFSSLHSNLQVTPLDSDQVKVTVTLPTEHFLHFARILDSLCGLVTTVNSKTRLARCQAVASVTDDRFRQRDQYYQRIAAAFDHYTAQGLNRTQSIKRIAADLRKEHHPWSSPDLVRSSLADAGRPGRPGRPKSFSTKAASSRGFKTRSPAGAHKPDASASDAASMSELDSNRRQR